MPNTISTHLGIDPESLAKKGVLDAVLDVDTRLFLDPYLLKNTKIPEFKKSRERIEKYYSDIIILISASQTRDDRAWKAAQRRLVFHEPQGTFIGYSVHARDGSAIGQKLGIRLIESADEIIRMGIKDPEIFELLGLFEKDFGADRLSDMTIEIIKGDLFRFTDRVASELGIKDLRNFFVNGQTFLMPLHPSGTKPIIFLPAELLRDLPVAHDWEGIYHVVATNTELRNRLNQLIGSVWRRSSQKRIPKSVLRGLIFENPNNIRELLKSYKSRKAIPYDYDNDPSGEIIWNFLGRKFAETNPVKLTLPVTPTINDIQNVVRQIVYQFKKNIEVNGLNEDLFIKSGTKYRPRHERFSQLLFYSTADTYCAANNLDVSREPNAGNGPVDFKLSKGYEGRVLVEVKLSTSSGLIKGFEKQLPVYEQSEGSAKSFYVVLQLTPKSRGIERLMRIYEEANENDKKTPEIIIIDASIKPSASKR